VVWEVLAEMAVAVVRRLRQRPAKQVQYEDVMPQRVCTGCGYDVGGCLPGPEATGEQVSRGVVCPECGKRLVLRRRVSDAEIEVARA
jgi:DNA-directed RNA polymerase subunit RPC12/RpoP